MNSEVHNSEVNEIDPVTVEVAVHVPWKRVKKGLDASYGRLQKSVRVRGFRPGKAPRSVLRQLYGQQVKSELIETLVQEGLLEAMHTHELDVVASPELKSVPTIAKGEPLSFKAKVEIRPKVEELIAEGLEVTRPSTEVSDEAVDAELERIRQQQADLVSVEEPRPAKAGDLLSIDYTVDVDGEPKEEMAATGQRVELGGDRLLPEFEEALIGKQVGDEVDIELSYGDDAPNPDLRNTKTVFHAKVTEMREKIVPALDDELAKDLGEYETLDELRAKSRSDLEAAATKRADSSVREQLLSQLVEKNPVPVPPSLVEQQVQSMKQELAFLMQMAPGLDLGGDDAGMHDRAEKKVLAALLMGELARREAISVAPEDIDAKLREIADASGKHIAKVRVEYAGEKRESLKNQLLEDKLLAFLLARATVTDAAPGTSAGGEEE